MITRVVTGRLGMGLLLAAAGPIAARDAAPPISGAGQNFTPAESLRPVPAIGFIALDGTRLSLADFRGRVVALIRYYLD